ncbi:HAMP domain-containing protein, partial [Escherichia coli]|uniref:HAMP domain-containing protein n=2 Tax=Pseudomonadota TaxID=1224 RepID=UPI003CF8A122
MFSIAAVIGGLLLAFFSWWSLRRAIGEPMQRALGHFDAIANGDLTQPVHVHSKNEMGQLLQGLSRMQESLSRT